MDNKRIAFQGEPGAYSEEALFLLEPRAQSQPYREFRDVTQCERVLRELAGVEVVAFYDTAGAAAEVARQRDSSLAAIAGELAARRYGLTIMAERIEDEPHNQTRFLLVAREPRSPPPGVP